MGKGHETIGGDWGMKHVTRYLRVYKRILEIAAMLLIEWRVAFVMWTVVHFIELAINLAFFQIILSRTQLIGGWGIYQIVILLGYMELLLGIGGQTFYPMMYEFGEKIRSGELDFKLLKPLDIQFLVSFPWTDVSDIFSLVTGSFMMWFGISHLHVQNFPLYFLLFVILFISSLVILYSIILLLLTICFKTTKFDSVSNLYWTTIWVGRYPISVFKGVFHTFLMFIVPVGLATSVPAQALAGVFNPAYTLYSIFLAVALFIISRKVFLSNIKNYSSASS